jgi:hypothetical protein
MISEQKKKRSLLSLDEHEDLKDFAVQIDGKVYNFAKSWNSDGIYVVDYRKGKEIITLDSLEDIHNLEVGLPGGYNKPFDHRSKNCDYIHVLDLRDEKLKKYN